MKVVAELLKGLVTVEVTSTVNGEEVTQDMHFPYETISPGVNVMRFTDEALQDLVALINNIEDN